MPEEQCRMVTEQGKGKQCSRSAKTGSHGFCWQHTPSKKSNSETWKNRLEGAALAIAASEILLKVVELAILYLPEHFGSGDPDQNAAKEALRRRIDLVYGHPPDEPNGYTPNSRVDWVELRSIVSNMDHVLETADGSEAAHSRVEQDFVRWFDNMNIYHKGLLLGYIEKESS